MLPYLFEVDNHVLPNFTSVKEPLNYIKLFALLINVLSKLNPQMNYGLYTASILLVSNSICNQGFGEKESLVAVGRVTSSISLTHLLYYYYISYLFVNLLLFQHAK